MKVPKMKSKKVEDQPKSLAESPYKYEDMERELERLRTWSKHALEQVKRLEAEKASLQKQVDDNQKRTTLLGRWKSNSNLNEDAYSNLLREKLAMEEDLTMMITDRDSKIAMLRMENQQLQRKENTEGISKSSKKKLEKVEKATGLLRQEINFSLEKICKMTKVVDDSVERLEGILDGLGQREECDEEDAMALALGESLSLLQQHVKVSLHLLEQKVNNRLDTMNDDTIQSNNDLLADIRIEVMALIRKADFELNEKIKYMQVQIDELKEC